jgi:trigger factor
LYMKATLGKKEGNVVEFTIEIPEADFEKAVQKSYLKNRGKFNIPGFRKGKVPRKIIEMNYGVEMFYEDAINIVLPEAYNNAIEELNLHPVDQPNVDIEELEKGKPVLVKIDVVVKPEVELGEYKGIEVEKIEYNVTEEIVEDELKSVQEMNARITDAGDRAVKQGDVLTIDFAGFIDDEAFEGGTAEGHELEIGSNQFIPGFEDQLVGKNKGEEVDVVVTFPEEYHEESLKGKEATFKVTIHEIKEKELPELDDEFAKDVSEFDTLEEYKNSIREKLEEEYSSKEKAENENNVIDAVIDASKVDIPEAMIESQLQTEVGEFDYKMRSQGLNLEQYLQITGSTEESLKDQLRPMAEKRVRGDLVLEAIAEKENIEVKEEDIDSKLEEMAETYKQENKEKFIKDMKKGDLSFLETAIKNQKVIDLLIENVKFK